MSIFSDFEMTETLRAAGLPMGLNDIVGCTVCFWWYNGAGFRCIVSGIKFAYHEVYLFLEARDDANPFPQGLRYSLEGQDCGHWQVEVIRDGVEKGGERLESVTIL